MRLGEYIDALEQADQEKVLPIGLCCPHSYRGDYSCIAFETTNDKSVSEMLEEAKECVGKHYQGYKGGSFLMDRHTPVYVAEYGSTGEELGPLLLRFILNQQGIR